MELSESASKRSMSKFSTERQRQRQKKKERREKERKKKEKTESKIAFEIIHLGIKIKSYRFGETCECMLRAVSELTTRQC